MGRKLNGFEGAGIFSPETDADRQDRTDLSRSEDLQQRIAEQLGISVAELQKRGEILEALHSANNLVRSTATSLSDECFKLLQAYMRITDPKQRGRCLQIVREAADASPATEV